MIIVTGASRGLGQAITERLIERGEEVIGLARNTSGLKINAIECDENTSLLQIAYKLNVPIWDLYDFCDKLEEHRLLECNV